MPPNQNPEDTTKDQELLLKFIGAVYPPKEQYRILVTEAFNWSRLGAPASIIDPLRERILELYAELYPKES